MAEMKTKNQVARMKPEQQRPKRLGLPLPSWEQRFQELESFKRTQGHCNVPARYPPNPALAKWVVNVRK